MEQEMLLQRPIILACCLALSALSSCAVPPVGTAVSPLAEEDRGTATASSATAGSPLPATQPSNRDYCADPQPVTLISRLKAALQASDGEELAALVSPVHGMEARLFRSGRVVKYDQETAKSLLVSAYVVDWGAASGSGLETRGSFRALIVPALLDVLNKDYSLTCNHVQVGGTTYAATWPYPGIDFHSVYDPGTPANANLDWHTWLLGMHYVDGKPYLYAITQFKWEP